MLSIHLVSSLGLFSVRYKDVAPGTSVCGYLWSPGKNQTSIRK